MNAHFHATRRAVGLRICLGCLLLFASAGPLRAQKPTEIGTVSPKEFQPRPIAVPPFDAAGGQALSGVNLGEALSNDLQLSGFFSFPKNPQFVQETHALDLKEGKIHFQDWARIGVSYVVKGKYSVNGDQLEAEVRTYDATTGVYIFGQRYVKYRATEGRRLAHYAANDIIQRITGFAGTAHTQIVYIRQIGARGERSAKEVYIMDADGRNARALTNDHNLAATPAWGANGTEVYYTTYKDYNPDLAGIFLDGSYNWFVSRRPGFNLAPDWSHAKNTIALTLTKDGNSEIYTMNREGKDLKRLTYNKAIDSSPCWSPKGDQMAFTSDRTGTPQIYVMDDSGVNVRQISKGNYSDAAAWSPKGDRIAYCSRVNGVFQVFIAGVNGEDAHPITSGNSNSEDPVWSPNGWVLAYTSDKTGSKQIHTMFIDGRAIAQLTQGSECYSPNWSPMLP